MGDIRELRKELKKIENSQKAKVLQGFFKAGKGQYGEGDIFIGLTVPQSRKIAINFRDLSFSEITQLLKSKIHEERLIALLILVNNFNVGDKKVQKKIFDFYLKKIKYINNWDLVDLSADKIIGGYSFARQPRVSDDAQFGRGPAASFPPASARSIFSAPSAGSLRAVGNPSTGVTPLLSTLAYSKNLWKRRISMVATYYFIKNNKFDETLKIAEILLKDRHDLIQKAVGWMLREVGKRDLKIELGFLNKYYKKMPRTMLRYAIEKFPEKIRSFYLKR